MKAFLLAAGIGSRLRPLTDSVPKCLLPINGLPLLHYWLKLFEKHHIDEVLINIHHLSAQIEEYCSSYLGPLRITLYKEKFLLGSYGSLIKNKYYFENESKFLICYSDNLSNINLTDFINSHSDCDLTMGLFHAPNPEECGIVEIDKDFNIVTFIEKPELPLSDLANAGIYIATPKIFPKKDIRGQLLDISVDLIPRMLGKKIRGYLIKDFILDIGTVENYSRANKKIRSDPSLFNEILS